MVEGIDSRTLAVIATKRIIDGISFRKKRTGFAIQLASKIEDEAYFRSYEEYNKKLFKTVEKDLNKRSSNYEYRRFKQLKQSQRSGFEWKHWTVTEKCHVGSTLLDLFITSTNFCRLELVITRKGKVKRSEYYICLLYTSPSPRDSDSSRMPSSA